MKILTYQSSRLPPRRTEKPAFPNGRWLSKHAESLSLIGSDRRNSKLTPYVSRKTTLDRRRDGSRVRGPVGPLSSSPTPPLAPARPEAWFPSPGDTALRRAHRCHSAE